MQELEAACVSDHIDSEEPFFLPLEKKLLRKLAVSTASICQGGLLTRHPCCLKIPSSRRTSLIQGVDLQPT